MTLTGFALRLALGLTLVAVLTAALVIGREALRRRRTRAAIKRLDAARLVLDAAAPGQVKELVAALRKAFDRLTIERAVEQLLGDDTRRVLGLELFRELGLVERHAARLREARGWAERTNAAQVLGRAGCPEAIPPLVLALRDPHEDGAVKTAAAEALAKLRDPRAVPFLVRELYEVDESASRPIAEALVRFGEVAVPELLGLLADEAHPAGRVWAARILGHVAATAAVEPLVALLHARNDLLRIAAAASLGQIQDRRALQPLVQATLRDPAPQVRAQAAGAVARIEAEGAVDVLVAALADPDYVTRLRALEAFENIQLKDTSLLVRALRDPKNEVRRRAALALERVGYLDRVVEEMASENPGTSRDAYFKLLELGRAGLTDAVVSFVNHASFQVRALAARAAGDLGAAGAGRLLLGALDDPDWPVRAAAVDTIGRLRLEGGVGPLVARLGDVAEAVREAAAEAVEAFPASALAPHARELVEAYARGTVPTRRHMVTIAARIDGDAAADLLVRASTDPSEAVRLQAVRVMGEQREAERFLPQLVDRITDASLEVRTAAVAALGAAVTADAFEALLRSLPGAPPALRERIAEALARGGRVHLFRRLDELSHVEDVDVRVGVAWTLGRIGEPAVLPYLEALLHATEPAVRASAAGALAKVDAPGSVDALLGACEDRDPRTRAAVVNALGKRGAGDPRVAARVRARLEDPDAFVRNRAALVLATVAGAEAEAALTDPDTAQLIDPAARLVALAVSGSEAALGRALDLMTMPNALQGAVAFLAHEDAQLRAAFAARLRLPDPAAVPLGLHDPGVVPHYDTVLRTSLDIESRRVAVEALARVPGALAVEVLADVLRSDPAEEIRLRTARALAPLASDDRARAALVRAVDDPSADVAIVAIRALRQSRDARAQSALFLRLGASSDAVREAVEESLAEMHRGDVMPLLDRIMGVDRPDVLVAGIHVLERIVDPATLPLLEYLLASRHEEVRAATLAALAKLPFETRTERAIDGTLDDPSERVRRAAIGAIASFADANAVRRLERVRFDPSPLLRIELARWLTSTPEEPSYAVLRALADDVVPGVRAAALASLLDRGQSRGLKLFLDRWKKGLVDLRDEPRAEAVTARLSLILAASADQEARQAAVGGIAALRAPGFEKYVVPALRDPSPEVRVDAIRALARHDDAQVRARIAELLDDPIAAVREAARRSHLRMIG
jgi:HEAT repeat protein